MSIADCSDFPNQKSIGHVRIFGNAYDLPVRYYRSMATRPQFDWFLSAWLDSKVISQPDLCRPTGFPKAKVSELVNGVSRYNRDVVNPLSGALHIHPSELLMHPDDSYSQKHSLYTSVLIAAVYTTFKSPE